MTVQRPFHDVAFWNVGEEARDFFAPVLVEFHHFLFVAFAGPGFCLFMVQFGLLWM